MLLEIIFAVVLLVAFITEVILTETEHFGWATALLLLCGGVCYYFNIHGVSLWIKAHVEQTLIFIGSYLVAGVVWSFIKWFSYLVSYRDKWREAKEKDAVNKVEWIAFEKKSLTKDWDFYNKNLENYNKFFASRDNRDPYDDRTVSCPKKPVKDLPQTDEEWDNYYKIYYEFYNIQARKFSKPLASDNKAKITAWMAFWPFSFLGTFINDPIRRLFNFIFSNFKKLYQRMSDHLFKDLETKTLEK